jgi:acetyl/propionyl-CoA carboxylase alpha subunit
MRNNNSLSIKKILIPNRGEIAVRIIRTAKRLGIRTVVTLARHEADALPASLADEVFWWPNEQLNETFLNIEAIINAAIEVRADAIHPGYGFLSENHELAKACETAGFVFIGPRAEHIQLMGSKTEARSIAKTANVPVVPGWEGSIEEITSKAHQFPYPVIVKAAMGGGGKGMKLVHSANELTQQLQQTANESLRYFGDATVFVEQYFEPARHIEVQLLGDKYGNLVHLGERECSIQRRFQKIIEEAPAPNLTGKQREALYEDALKLGRYMNYQSAGTIEFLVNEAGQHFFLEMNTRIQVEHPVSELITNIDIVEKQIEIASGLPLDLKQEAIHFQGHAIESRLYAEDASSDFRPSPGTIRQFAFPNNNTSRIETAIYQPVTIHPNYDPLLAKIVTWGKTRETAIAQHLEDLNQCSIIGIETNKGYLRQVIQSEAFTKGDYHTRFCNSFMYIKSDDELVTSTLVAYACLKLKRLSENRNTSFFRHLPQFQIVINNQLHTIRYHQSDNQTELTIDHTLHLISHIAIGQQTINYKSNNINHLLHYFVNPDDISIDTQGTVYQVIPTDWLQPYQPKESLEKISDASQFHAPLPGRVLKIHVDEGQFIAKGDTILVLEAMKMENHLKAWKDITIKEIHITEGHSVKSNQLLISTY